MNDIVYLQKMVLKIKLTNKNNASSYVTALYILLSFKHNIVYELMARFRSLESVGLEKYDLHLE